MKTIRTAVMAAMLACGLGAQAEPLRVQVPAQYADNAPVMPRIREECAVEEMLGNYVFAQLAKKYPDAMQVSGQPELDKGRALKPTILSVQGVGGGGWSGAKAILARAELLQDGQVIRSAVRRDHSRGGMLGMGRGTCSILELVADSLGKQFTEWLYVTDAAQRPAAVAPTEAPAETPSAPAETAAPGGNPQSAP